MSMGVCIYAGIAPLVRLYRATQKRVAVTRLLDREVEMPCDEPADIEKHESRSHRASPDSPKAS
jgi:hypothetical protein